MMDNDMDGYLTKDEVTAFLGNICQEYGLSTGNTYDKAPNKRNKDVGKISGIRGVAGKGAL